MITTHVGDTITLTNAFRSLAQGNTITVSAGCAHTPEICKSKFGNAARYGGFAYVPNKNPFVVGM
jgi:hypothetical protein